MRYDAMNPFTRLSTVLAWLAAILFAASGAMLSWEVAARYFFIRPTIWAAELSQLCLIWGCLISMPWVLAARRHIRITAVTSLLPPRAARALELLVMLIIAVFSAVVLWQGWHIFEVSFDRGRTTGSLLNLPAWLAELAVPVGFALLLVQAVIEGVGVLRHGATPDPDRDVE